MKGKRLVSPKAMNKSFSEAFSNKNWNEKRTSYWVTGEEKLIRRTMSLSPKQQKAEIEAADETPIYSYNQTDITQLFLGRTLRPHSGLDWQTPTEAAIKWTTQQGAGHAPLPVAVSAQKGHQSQQGLCL